MNNEECDWPIEEYVAPELIDERKRIITGSYMLLLVIQQGAPPEVKGLAGQTLANMLGLCPLHSTLEDVKGALADIGLLDLAELPLPEPQPNGSPN